MNHTPATAAQHLDHVPDAATCVQRLVRNLSHRVEADGEVRECGSSRILETALLLSLLRKQQTHPDVQARLTAYLTTAPATNFIDAAITDRALHQNGRAIGSDDGFQAALDALHPFTGHRKRLQIATLLAILDVIPYDSRVRPEDIRYSGHAAWTDLSMCAVKMLHTAAQGGTPSDTDTAWLGQRLARAPEGQVWEGNLLVHLTGLHALHARQPDHPAIGHGIITLAACARPDGGLPFVRHQSVFITALAGTALAAGGADPAVLERIGGYLTAQQKNNGGWGYDDATTQTDVDTTTRCAVALCDIGGPSGYPRSLARADAYLMRMAGHDGGYPTFLAGHPSEPEMTAGSLIALTLPAPTDGQHHDRRTALVRAAAEFLITAQNRDGSWERSWTRSVTAVTTYALDALEAAAGMLPVLGSRTQPAVAAARAYLVATQNEDGGWGHGPLDSSDVISTAHALSGLRTAAARNKAVRYLISRQHEDGRYTAPPDQLGPRPLPYGFPILADIHVLTALTRTIMPRRPPAH